MIDDLITQLINVESYIPTKLKNIVKFIYITGYYDDEQSIDPNFKYLQSDMKFESDSILIYPSSSFDSLIIELITMIS